MGSPKDTRWERKDFTRKKSISETEKDTIFSYYEAGLKIGKTSDELLEELAEKYDRSPRQIQRYISQLSAKRNNSSGDYVDQFVTINTHEKHLDQIKMLIQKWRSSFDTRHRPIGVYVLPPSYSVEQEKLFPFALDHCPSVNDEYQALLKRRDEYQAKLSALKKSQSEQWRQTFTETESKLREALDMCLLSQEYSRHRCTLCLPDSR